MIHLLPESIDALLAQSSDSDRTLVFLTEGSLTMEAMIQRIERYCLNLRETREAVHRIPLVTHFEEVEELAEDRGTELLRTLRKSI